MFRAFPGPGDFPPCIQLDPMLSVEVLDVLGALNVPDTVVQTIRR